MIWEPEFHFVHHLTFGSVFLCLLPILWTYLHSLTPSLGDDWGEEGERERAGEKQMYLLLSNSKILIQNLDEITFPW